MSKTFEVIFKEFANSETFVMSRALLEDYKAKAAQETEQRIIKLLEADKIDRQPVCSNTDCEKCPAFERGFDRAMALIKGENK